MTESEFLRYLARKVQTAGSQEKLAKQLGVTQPYLSQVLCRKRPASRDLLTALGLRKRPLEIEDVR